MAAEIELKLSIQANDIPTLQMHPLLATQPYKTKLLCNQYFDTPEQSLSNHMAALRIRTVAGAYIQTLKTRGTASAGLSQRNEWEWNVPSEQLDISLIDDTMLPEGINKQQLAPLFKTDFTRLEYQLEFAQSKIELVIDQGQVSAAGKADPICEIELELKAGIVDDLFALANELSSSVCLMPADISKAERGYRLLNGIQNDTRAINVTAVDQKASALFQHLFASELELATRAFEHFSFCEDWHYLASFRRNIGNLRSLLTFFAPIIGSADLAKNAVNQLGLMLDSLVGWLPDEEVIHSVVAELEQSLESWCAQQVKNKALALSSNAAFTQQLLNLSHWIQQFDCDDQTSIDDFAPAQLKNEWLQLNLSQNRFSISQWMSTKARATMLDLLSEHVQALANQPLNVTQLKAMNRLLSELAATDELMKNQDWLKSLNEKQYSALQSQHRKSTILVGALNRVSRTH